MYSGVHNPSDTHNAATPPGPQDFLSGAGICGPAGKTPLAGQNGRCGYGPRLPLIVISPYARTNFIDYTLTDQSSILKFVENSWRLPRIAGSLDKIAGTLDNLFDFRCPNSRGHATTLFLDPTTGQPFGQ